MADSPVWWWRVERWRLGVGEVVGGSGGWRQGVLSQQEVGVIGYDIAWQSTLTFQPCPDASNGPSLIIPFTLPRQQLTAHLSIYRWRCIYSIRTYIYIQIDRSSVPV